MEKVTEERLESWKNLSKEQAVEEHRKMWNWLADNPTKNKWDYFEEIGGEYRVAVNCFCCEYAIQRVKATVSEEEWEKSCNCGSTAEKCNYCPIDWGNNARYSCCYSGDEFSGFDYEYGKRGAFDEYCEATNISDWEVSTDIKMDFRYGRNLDNPVIKSHLDDISRIARRIAELPERDV